MAEVVGTTGRRTTDIAKLTGSIPSQLGLARVAFLFTRIVSLLSLIVTRPLKGVFGGSNQGPHIGMFSEGLVNPFAFSALRRLRSAQGFIAYLAQSRQQMAGIAARR